MPRAWIICGSRFCRCLHGDCSRLSIDETESEREIERERERERKKENGILLFSVRLSAQPRADWLVSWIGPRSRVETRDAANYPSDTSSYPKRDREKRG